MAPPDIDLIEMTDPAIARGDRDVFELYVHIVLGYSIKRQSSANILCQRGSMDMELLRGKGTFDQFASVHLARCDFKRDNMVLHAIISALLKLPGRGKFMVIGPHTWASFSSFIGIPMVLVILKVDAQGGNDRNERSHEMNQQRPEARSYSNRM